MFRNKKENADYSKISLSDFSDDDSTSSDEENNISDPRRSGTYYSDRQQQPSRNGGGVGTNNYTTKTSNNNSNGMPTTTATRQQQQQQQLLQQDQGLEMLSQSAERLGNLSMAISDELSQQNVMLDEMDQELDQAHAGLDVVTRKTKEFLEKAGLATSQNCWLIATLSGVVLLLLFLILYT